MGAPAIGEILADRYRIEEHVNDDSTGRQVWRGVDVILRRAVTIVLRTPGGAEADEMLGAAVAASRVIHPNIVGVYDAIDEGTRAYVVREWVEGEALRDTVRDAPLHPSQAIPLARAVADALSAVHATGVSHGNVHPGTVLLSVDNRVVLGDARASDRATAEADVRAVGALLYCALTGHWPRDLGPSGWVALPDAPRLDNGQLASPRQVRGGVPAALDRLTMDLLDPAVPAPGAAELAVELARLGYHDVAYDEPDYHDNGYRSGHHVGPLPFAGSSHPDADEPRPVMKKLTVGVAGLLAIILAGLLGGLFWFATDSSNGPPSASETNAAGNSDTGGDGSGPKPIKLNADMMRLVDSKGGDRTESDGIERAVDSDPGTGWSTDEYNSPRFGDLKAGMGLLIDLGKARKVSSVNLTLSAPDAEISIRAGDEDYGDDFDGDKQIVEEYDEAYGPKLVETTAKIPVDVNAQYMLIWITELPTYEGKFQVEIKEIQILSGA
ncbi:MAG: protein kinase family protein [Micromonosporaceae bacterium]